MQVGGCWFFLEVCFTRRFPKIRSSKEEHPGLCAYEMKTAAFIRML